MIAPITASHLSDHALGCSLDRQAGALQLPQTISTERTTLSRLKAILGGCTGNLVEWYDWSVYIYFTLYFAPHFFPQGDRTAQLLQASAISAVGFLARPLGAWLMGLYADRSGRRAALTLSVALMSVGSLVIAVCPDYAAIGVMAPAILLAARIVQGLSVGGEYGASATYLSEFAGTDRRGFWSSFQYVTLIAGQLLAIGLLVVLQTLLPKSDLDQWAWRIPFAIGAVLAVVVFWLRRGIEESPSFEARATQPAQPQKGAGWLFVKHPRETLMVMGLTAAGSLSYYLWTSYMQKFLVNTSGFSKPAATTMMAIALAVFMCLQPLFGALSDRVGRKPMLIFAFGGGMLTVIPLMTALQGAHSAITATLLIILALTIQSGYSAISGVFKAELFPTSVRALGVALPYALANSIFGGTADYVALWFKQHGHESGFYIYVAAILAVGTLTTLFIPDMRKRDLVRD
jgi:MHS family alpha-ketoglutarate permease-like MFS transporter